MGSAILADCAKRGASVIGIEQFTRGHDLGSASGKSRLIRKAYFEEPAYVPLLRRAYELWRILEAETGTTLLRTTGLLSVGEEGSAIIAGTSRAALEHDLPLERLSRQELKARYPMLDLWPDEAALFEVEGGVLNPERAIDAHLHVAEDHGAEMRFEAQMQSWNETSGGFEILLANGERIGARRLILALGPWFKEALEALGIPIRVQRNVQAWFSPAKSAYAAPHFPAFLLNRRGLPAPLYGFPDFGDGVKAAFHGAGDLTDAAHIDRAIDVSRDIDPLARELEQWMPGAATSLREAKACMYTLTPDEHFVIDQHPDHPGVTLCGGFSGHGFKFAPVVGEIAAALALNESSRHEIGFLSLRRFRSAAGPANNL